MIKQKIECRFCRVDTIDHIVLKRRRLVKFEETGDFIDLRCINIVLIKHQIGYYNKSHKRGNKKYKFFREECNNHILLLKKMIINNWTYKSIKFVDTCPLFVMRKDLVKEILLLNT